MPCPLTLPPNLRLAAELITAQAQAINARLGDMERDAEAHRDDERWQARWKRGVAALASLNDLRELLGLPIVRLAASALYQQRQDRATQALALQAAQRN